MNRVKIAVCCLLFGLLAATNTGRAESGFLKIRNSYFWDPATQDYFIPRGVAYQIWNPPVGANQSFAQVDYDLLEFAMMHANSVRAELTWGQVQIAPNQYDWTKADHLVSQAEKLGLKLFLIIGYQYPPAWLPGYCRGINNQGLRMDVVQSLANSWPSNALKCLPAPTASALQSINSPATLSQVLTCLITGARAGGISNILHSLQSDLTPDQLQTNLPYLISDVINYEDPQARAAYQQYIGAVTARYKDSPAIGAWILGNEYAYFDLWEDRNLYPVHRFLGYDSLGQQSFQSFLRSLYHTNIAALKTNWQAAYSDFFSVPMPLEYPADRRFPGFHDLIQWRKQSIGSFVAQGALAARQADPNHLLTYSMIGAIFNGVDANYTCEDAKAIVSLCAAAGAPLDFWSVNNYARALNGSELRSAAFGIEKYQSESGLPVMVSETGYSSTEDLFDYDPATGYSYAGARQPKALPSTMWESLLCGAIGVHFFTWNDRSLFTQGYFYRERGFGIVEENRLPKPAVYNSLVAMFRQLDNIRVERLLGGSTSPPPDVQLFWSTNADMVWPSANQEDALIWGALKRLGFQLRIIDDDRFEQGAYTNSPALLLSRCLQMDPRHLYQLASNVIPAGIHLHAQADLPGQYDAYCRTNPDWASLMETLFGIDLAAAKPGLDLVVTDDCYSPINLRGTANLGLITPSFAVDLQTWEMWRKIVPVSGQVILTDSGFPNLTNGAINCPYLDPTPYPALVVNATGSGRGKTAVNPFALGDTYNWSGTEAAQWEMRYSILRAIYRDQFGLRPKIELSGPGSQRVLPSYRLCANGSVLIALLNEDTNAAVLTISAPELLTGRKVEVLSAGGILATNSTGILTYTSQGDACAILYAYSAAGPQENSLINSNANKLWFQNAPLAVWPSATPCQVAIGYDTIDANLSLVVSLEQISPHPGVYGQSSVTNIAGKGTALVQVPTLDADPNNPDYISSHQGAQYVFHARLLKSGVAVTDLSLPVRLLFGVYPTQPLPANPVPGRTYPITLAWEELPSYASGNTVPLDRAAAWDSLALGQEHYRIVLELQSGSLTVSSNSFLTSAGTGSNTISVQIPSGATGPFAWLAYLQTATNVLSRTVAESFEGYERGANWQGPGRPFLTNNFLAPWRSFVYPPNPTIWLNEGVQLIGSDGSQSAFIVATNPASVAVATLGMTYQFPQAWALPAVRTQWTNYVFSYDFMESHGYACSVEMQIKDTNSNWIQFTNLYSGSNVWFTLNASLNEFQPPPPGVTGPFDSNHVSVIVLNIRMLVPDVVYVGSFDNIQFLGPEIDQGGGQIISSYTSANDAAGWLSVRAADSQVQVSWVGNGILQSAPALTGTWNDLTNASNPLVFKPQVTNQFYRLRR